MKLNRTLAGAVTGLAALTLAACGDVTDPLVDPLATAGDRTVVVGSASFTESTVVAELYAQALTAQGVPAATQLDIGSREVYLQALCDGSVSLVPEYTGKLLLHYDQSSTATTSQEVDQALPGALPPGLVLGQPSTAVDQDVYVVTKAYAGAHGIASLGDLSKVSGHAVLGGPSELEGRAYGPAGLDQVYGATVSFQPYDTPAVRARDLTDGKIEIGEFFSTEAVVVESGFVVLEDPQGMILPQNIVPLMRSELADTPEAVDALDAVQAALTTEALSALDQQVDTEHQDPHDVAAAWLRRQGLG